VVEIVRCRGVTVRLRFNTDGVDWAEVVEVFRRAPLGEREPEKLRRGCENSFVVCFAYDDDTLIGMARAISDGEYYAGLYDVVVLPEYQGKGVGTAIMEAIHERLPVKATILFAAPGKEPFYKKCGYHKLLTGMMRAGNVDYLRTEGYIE
jgi:GNAT superfamily N-acetyltransferase